MSGPGEWRLGKAAAKRDPRTLRYGAYRTMRARAESPPDEAHWGHGLPFGMLDNDKYGNCVEAGYAHQVQIWCDRTGKPFTPTAAEADGAYSAITGFSPDNPSSDQGTDMLTACRYWKSTGLAGHEIAAFASLQPQEDGEVREAVAWYGGAYLGLQLPVSAQDQTGSGPWTVTTGPDAQAGSWGGHCVPVSGYDAKLLYVVTWGAIQAMTWEFLATYADEAYVLLSHDWIAATGQSPGRLSWGQLMGDLANL